MEELKGIERLRTDKELRNHIIGFLIISILMIFIVLIMGGM